MLENIINIYHSLEDDLSKTIFLNRLQFAITGQFEYINRIVDTISSEQEYLYSNEDVQNLKREIQYCRKDKIVIYGAGMLGKLIEEIVANEGFDIVGFCDINLDLQNTLIHDIPVFSPEQLGNHCAGDTIILFAVWEFHQPELIKYFMSCGYERENLINSFRFLRPRSLYNENMYFEPTIIQFGANEVFIDGGSYDFSTSLNLLKHCSSVKKIIAFEPDPNNAALCEKAISDSGVKYASLINAGLWSDTATLGFNAISSVGSCISMSSENKISITSIDDVLNGEKATFIKMDIEGAELEALIGAKKTIQKYAPKLAISIYHKQDDFITLPQYILTLVPKYKLYLRHYTNMPVDTILYATL